MRPFPADLAQALAAAPARATPLPGGRALRVYGGETTELMLSRGFLNIAVEGADGPIGLGVAELRECGLPIRGQPRATQLNASAVAGADLDGGRLHLQHWEGFRTEMDAASLDILGQVFTK